MVRAMLQVPQGGAAKNPLQLGDITHEVHNFWASGKVKSRTLTGAIWLSLRWSTPKECVKPHSLRAAVTRPDRQTTRVQKVEKAVENCDRKDLLRLGPKPAPGHVAMNGQNWRASQPDAHPPRYRATRHTLQCPWLA